ncbi:MFS transporter [soil metagenome]
MLLSSLGTSIASAALPTLAGSFSAPFQHVQWIVLAYLLAITTVVVSVGRLGDLTGRRRLLVAGLVLFTLASALCGVAPTLWFLVAARAVQGAGAAIMIGLPLALTGGIVSRERTGGAIGLLGTMSAVGTAVGPSLGGLLVASLGWQAIFLLNLPLGVLATLLAHRHLPADQRSTDSMRTRFDYGGALLLAGIVAAYALATTIGRGHVGPVNAGLALAAVIGLGVFVFVESRAASPLLRLSMLRDPLLSAGLVTSALVSTVIMATLVVGPFYLSRALGLETAVVGLVLSIGPVVAALSGIAAGRLVDGYGEQSMTLAGLTGAAVGTIMLALPPVTHGMSGYIAPIVFVTAGYALFQTANNTRILGAVNPDERGTVSGMLSLSRNLGLITGASVMGAVFALASRTSEISTAQPETVAAATRITFTVAAILILMAVGVAVAAGQSPRAMKQADECPS